MKIRDILEAQVLPFKKKASGSYKDAAEKQNNFTHRADVGIEPCEYCGEYDCDFDCDASQSNGFTTEARVPGLNYKEVPVSKKDLSVDKVILTLKAKDSEVMTKMAKRYKEIDDLEKMINAERDQMNAEVKKKMGDLFDANDVWVTRVIETQSVSMNLAKQSESTLPSVEIRVDWEKTAKELLDLMEGDLLQQGKNILMKYTDTVRLAGSEPKSPALRVKIKDSVDHTINESRIDSLQKWAKKYLGWFKTWGRTYDSKLNSINTQIKALGAK